MGVIVDIVEGWYSIPLLFAIGIIFAAILSTF